LRLGLVGDQTWFDEAASNIAVAKADVFDYIKRFYNPLRRHSAFEYLSPMEFEQNTRLA
jgi:transposase InsO family protein